MPDITPRAKVSPAVWHRLSHPKITSLLAQALPGLAPAPRWHWLVRRPETRAAALCLGDSRGFLPGQQLSSFLFWLLRSVLVEFV